MKFGIATFPTDYSIAPTDLAVGLEERNFESMWVAEHSHIPASRKSPWPGGAELPKMYYDVMDPFVVLSAAAAVTSQLKLATGICLVVQRDPFQTAKQIASLDQISNGRFLFGIGGGWNAEEMADHGTAFDSRFRLMRERIEAMKLIWSESQAEYHGKLVDFAPLMTWPKPVQKPHPPIHVGGAFPGAVRRAIRYGNGWMPIHGRDSIVDQLPELREMATEAGRDPEDIEVTIYGCPAQPEVVESYREAGVQRLVFGLPPEDRGATLSRLDRMREIF
ncbi:MAG: LLM class F420-dependent oxidoreductase [Myxococcota bacterium]|nr:LLM class F420-dependent oxidoreductase [Myxococcota bacterium]